MKLKNILAREWREWPVVDGVIPEFIVQEYDGALFSTRNHKPLAYGLVWRRADNDDWACGYYGQADLAEDWSSAIITHDQWERARAKYLAKHNYPLENGGNGSAFLHAAVTDNPELFNATATCDRWKQAADEVTMRDAFMAGFKTAKQPFEDMSDWRNWRAGDLLECVDHRSDYFTVGKTYKVSSIGEGGWVSVAKDDSGAENARSPKFFKFHSRP